ncbi:MAG TPA: hypothetical protein VFZ89_12755 [Solirubrobacteraceae bacterium]
MAGRPLGRDELARRRARRVGAAGVLAAALLPVVLFHRVVGEIAAGFRMDLNYLITGWTPWVLMALGLLCAIPIAIEDLRNRDGRFYRPGTGAWAGWGVTLYLLGFALATQVSQIADSISS